MVREMPFRNQKGFTLIELVIVIIIMGIVAAVVLQSGRDVYDAAKVEQTKEELNSLAEAMIGNPQLQNNGVRSDFGYIGDIGSIPPNLDALHANPGGYATWNGPYIENRFSQIADDYGNDAWGAPYVFTGGVTITSTGSGSNIVVRVAGSGDELLRNQVGGNIYDLDGTPPGDIYRDSVVVLIEIPDGSGSVATKSSSPDAGGYFAFDSIPIGNHDLQIVYLPQSDTIRRIVSTPPGSNVFAECRFAEDLWNAGAGGSLDKVTGSDSLYADCRGFYFWVENNTGNPITISSLTVTWTSPTAYYRYVIWDGTVVFDSNNPKNGSGDVALFSTPQTINDGDSLRVDIDNFRSNPTGGPNVEVDNTTFTVTLSNGSSFSVSTGACP